VKYRHSILTIGLIILLVCVNGCISNSASTQSSSGEQQQSSRGIVITEKTDSWGESFGEPLFIVQGVVTNQLGHEEGYIVVICTIYDSNGVKLGESNDGLGALANGASVRFEVEVPTHMLRGGFPKDFKYSCEAKPLKEI
jgi:hypothetical protein